MIVGLQKSVAVPLIRSEVRRDFCRHTLALRRILSIRRRDKDKVHIIHLTSLIIAVATLVMPRSKLHQPRGELHNGPFADGGIFARGVDAEQNAAVGWQVLCIPMFRLWRFLVELLLKLLEADEGH
jgi:hypothetical protein